MVDPSDENRSLPSQPNSQPGSSGVTSLLILFLGKGYAGSGNDLVTLLITRALMGFVCISVLFALDVTERLEFCPRAANLADFRKLCINPFLGGECLFEATSDRQTAGTKRAKLNITAHSKRCGAINT
jgi:hypothetical protein